MKLPNYKCIQSIDRKLKKTNWLKMSSPCASRYEIPNLTAIRLRRLIFNSSKNTRVSLSIDSQGYPTGKCRKNNRFNFNRSSNKLTRTFSDSVLNKTCSNKKTVNKFCNLSNLKMFVKIVKFWETCVIFFISSSQKQSLEYF